MIKAVHFCYIEPASRTTDCGSRTLASDKINMLLRRAMTNRYPGLKVQGLSTVSFLIVELEFSVLGCDGLDDAPVQYFGSSRSRETTISLKNRD